jgi:BirA family biotin operon repressor/biotin-[acetyl-CoA-carboxylase] ligase
MDTPFDLRRIRAETFLRGIEAHRELPSTNDRALQLAAQGDIAPPWLVLATRQTSGRGRGTNRWWAAEGSLTFSLIVDVPGETPAEGLMSLVSPVSALAVCRALEQLHPDLELRLKWPNDVYARGKKVCGILLESPSRPAGRMVVGIGVNVNNSFTQAPPQLQETATAICDLTGRRLDLTEVLVRILQQMQAVLDQLAARRLPLRELWTPRCMLKQRRVRVVSGRECVEGICQGLDDDGALLVATDAGPRRCLSGTVAPLAHSR